jgi:predicted transcriptional regulator
MKLNKVDEAVVKTLKAEGKELTLQEISEKSGQASKAVFKSLRKLFENNMVDTNARKYRLLTDQVPNNKKTAKQENNEN